MREPINDLLTASLRSDLEASLLAAQMGHPDPPFIVRNLHSRIQAELAAKGLSIEFISALFTAAEEEESS